MPFQDKVLIVRNSNGTFSATYFVDLPVPTGKTNSEFFDERVAKFVKNKKVTSYFIKDRKDMRDAIKNSTLKSKGHIKIDEDGNFYEDTDYKTPNQLRKEKHASIKTKLKSASTLTDDEIDLLLGNLK